MTDQHKTIQTSLSTRPLKAMILAAGRGQRMMPLTKDRPKPLLEVNGKPLLTYHIEALKAAGITQIVINHSYLGQLIEDYYQTGESLGVTIDWSRESQPLETAGGILQALPLLGDAPFVLVNGDVWSQYPFSQLLKHQCWAMLESGQTLAHLVLVNNPPQHPNGDFGLSASWVENQGSPLKTFSGISVISPRLFAGLEAPQVLPLAPLLRQAITNRMVTGELFNGEWRDIGTPQRLDELNRFLTQH